MKSAEFWMLLSGLGLFLYGMFHLEDSMKQVQGRSFKLFLQKHTQHKLKAIFSGMIVTAIMQSSSIVNLIVLSFVGAGILSMRNALAVVLGANIGGTFNSWLVAILGFKVELNLITLPLIGIAGIALIAFKNKKTVYKIARFGMGFGLLLLGLQYMKESMDGMIKHFDFTPYLSYSRIVFVLIGFIITSLVQTSSATVVLVLSALYAKIIPIDIAVAVVLGAELGTTIKVVLGSIGGIASKKRVALGNFMFNIFSSTLGFIFLLPIITIIKNTMGIKDPIFILVAFQTFINVGSVILFYFFLGVFGNFLESRFKKDKIAATQFLQLASPEIADLSIEMMEKEVHLFIETTIQLNMDTFEIEQDHSERYNKAKETEGEIVLYYAKMLDQQYPSQYQLRMTQLMEALRNAMYAAKGIKDIYANNKELSSSINENKFELYQQFKAEMSSFTEALKTIIKSNDSKVCVQELETLSEKIKNNFDQRIGSFYNQAGNNSLQEKDLSTLFNVNREIYSSCKAIILSIKELKSI